MTIRIATWNITSARLRGEIVTRAPREEGHVLCLQEKPLDAFASRIYGHVPAAGWATTA